MGSGTSIREVRHTAAGTILSVVTFDENEVLDETFTAIAPDGGTLDEIESVESAAVWLDFVAGRREDWSEAAQDAMERRAENGRW